MTAVGFEPTPLRATALDHLATPSLRIALAGEPTFNRLNPPRPHIALGLLRAGGRQADDTLAERLRRRLSHGVSPRGFGFRVCWQLGLGLKVQENSRKRKKKNHSAFQTPSRQRPTRFPASLLGQCWAGSRKRSGVFGEIWPSATKIHRGRKRKKAV